MIPQLLLPLRSISIFENKQMRAITHKLCFDLAEDLLYDLNEYGVQVRLGGSVNLADWFKVSIKVITFKI